MKTKLSLLAFTSLLSGQLFAAETTEPVNDWKPAPSNQAGKQYPQYNSEGRVKFRIVAPEAKSVGCTFRDSSAFAFFVSVSVETSLINIDFAVINTGSIQVLENPPPAGFLLAHTRRYK